MSDRNSATDSLEVVSQVNGAHLIVEELGDELIVFDRRANKAHMLNARSAAIWRASASGTTVDSLCRNEVGDLDMARAVVELAILELERAGLVMRDGTSDRRSRRALLKTLGTGVVTPLVISILAPTSASAATTCNMSSGGNGMGSRVLTSGTCGLTCSTVVGPFTCDSSSSATAAADGCSCAMNNDCCSGSCSSNTCVP